MDSRRLSALLLGALLALPGLTALAAANSAPSSSAPAPAHPHPHVTARPPLQAIPATPGTGTVQQRMRQCNGQADAHKLRDASRETFIKSCMATRRPARKPVSSAAAEPQHHP